MLKKFNAYVSAKLTTLAITRPATFSFVFMFVLASGLMFSVLAASDSFSDLDTEVSSGISVAKKTVGGIGAIILGLIPVGIGIGIPGYGAWKEYKKAEENRGSPAAAAIKGALLYGIGAIFAVVLISVVYSKSGLGNMTDYVKALFGVSTAK